MSVMMLVIFELPPSGRRSFFPDSLFTVLSQCRQLRAAAAAACHLPAAAADPLAHGCHPLRCSTAGHGYGGKYTPFNNNLALCKSIN